MNKIKSNLFKFILVLSFIFGINLNAKASFQVSTLGFVSQKTSTVGLSFLLQSGSTFRFFSGFSFQSGGAASMQGEFSLGGTFYPLNRLTKSFAQPFIGLDGFIGLGQTTPESPDGGYDLSVGVDLKFFKKYGLTIKVDSHIGSVKDQRLGFGFYYRM